MELKWALLLGLFLPSCSGCAIGYKFVKRKCVDEDECAVFPIACGGHAQCVNTEGSYYCTCNEGFKENLTGTCKDINECFENETPCSAHMTCENSIGSYKCICPHGYQQMGKADCEDVDECVSSVCGVHSSCFNTPGSFLCGCSPGFHRHENGTSGPCEDINECLDPDVCGTNADCYNHQGGYSCKCHEGYSNYGNNQSKCIEMDCDQFEPESDGDHTPKKLKHLMSLLKNSCESLNDPHGERFTGEKLLESSSDLLHKMSSERSDDKERSVTYQLNSKVVTAVVSNAETKQLSEPVTLVFTHVEERAESGGVAYSCVYWDEAEGAWSGRGCEGAESNSTHTVCSCSHLSSFAVLMALYPVQDSFDLVVITQVGLVLSLVCLFLCILTFQFCRSIQGTRTSIHLHLSICLFIADLVFLCGISSTHNQVACAIVAGLLHFFFLSAFCWMLLEGVQLYRMVVLVFHTTLKHLYMFAVGYGVPLVIVAVSAIAFPKGYGTDRHCWLSLDRYFILSFFVPVCIVMILNSFFFIITVWKLAQKFSSLNPDLSNLNKIRSFTVTAVAQLCILGGTWIFGFLLFQEEGTEVMLYLFTILNSLQGAFIFIMHCLLSKPVRTEYYHLFGRMCPHKKKVEYSSSNSQKPLRSDGSTGESQI
ncbi:adhesion G protein-coupled receptor E1-like [Sinocyclocheilus rhinocerous]|uniref:adhesion G protein-coupled receptor E1-like n=1 Tax=Sinocyclocheilus rhinocerous TaxID=307959 RepID=UPI0007B7FAE0|nr:PREDICTED: adhesion G protein-coupled receptor E1-like [Sinocyclocheilus rhinocerous]